MDLARFFFGEPHQLVVEVDGFERLDEQRVAAGARAVDHAVELAALPGDHRHHEALVADGDELLLQHALFAVRFEEALERFLDRLLLPLDIAAQARQRDAGVVGDAAVGQDLAVEFAQQRAEIADGLRARAQARKALGAPRSAATWRRPRDPAARTGRRSPCGSRLAPSMRSLCTAGSTSGKPPKSMRIAAPRAAGLRARGGAQIFDGFAGFGQIRRRAARGRRAARPSPARACPVGWRHSGPAAARSASNSRTSALVFNCRLYFATLRERPFRSRRACLR